MTLAVVVAALAVGPSARAAAAGQELVLSPDGVPGYKQAGKGAKVARSAAGRHLPRALRKARGRGAKFTAAGRQLRLGAFPLGGKRAASRALAAAGRTGRHKRAKIGDAAFVWNHRTKRAAETTVIFRVGSGVGAVSHRSKGRRSEPAGPARAYAEALAARMDRVLNLDIWERTLDRIGADGSVAPKVALQAFAIAFGKVPGTKVPKGRRPGPVDGTLAIGMVRRVWDQLTPAQQRAINEATGLPHARAPATRARTPRDLRPFPAAQALADRYLAFYRGVIPGVPDLPIVAQRSTEPLEDGFNGADADEANAAGEWGTGAVDHCQMRVFPGVARLAGSAEFRLFIAHETFHCVVGFLYPWSTPPEWIEEGLAEWAGIKASSAPASVGSGFYRDYLTTIDSPLFGRSYDAVGFWGYVADRAGDGAVWNGVPTIIRAPSDGAFALAGAPLKETWASAAWRSGAGPAWTQSQPYALARSNPAINPVGNVTSDAELAAAAYSTTAYLIHRDGSRPLVNVRGGAGFVRIAQRGTDFGNVGFGGQWFCFGECECPPDQISSIPDHIRVSSNLTAAVTDGSAPASGAVSYHTIEEFCEEEEEEEPFRPEGPGESNGDPHMTSLDGLHYDFQAAGEFVLVRSGDIEVQARQEPFKRSKHVTMNTQVAMAVSGHRVTVSPGTGFDAPPVARIDGSVDPLPTGETRPLGDGRVSRSGRDGEVHVTWADGSYAVVRTVGFFGVSVNVALADARRGTVSGMLGGFDGNAGNDLATRGGERIPYRLSDGGDTVRLYDIPQEFKRRFTEDLYDKVGDSWRIKQSESLFDYGPGENTKTFTDRSIPKRTIDPEELKKQQRRRAERICRAQGVTEPSALEDCILDVALTGEEAFARDAAIAQDAVRVPWTRLGAGAFRSGPLSLARAVDGALHLTFVEPTGSEDRVVNVPVSPSGAEGATETITVSQGSRPGFRPNSVVAPDGGVHAEVAEYSRPSGPFEGIYEYARSPGGAWSPLGPVTTADDTGRVRPSGVYAGGTLFTTSPYIFGARVFRGAAADNPGHALETQADCSARDATLAHDAVTGAVWAAWIQSSCTARGVFVQQLDGATGQPIGAPVQPPEAAFGSDSSVPDGLAFTGWPGQPGVYLAFTPGEGDRVVMWRVGDPAPISIPPRQGRINRVQLAPEPHGGRLWIGWVEYTSDGAPSRLWLRQMSAPGALSAATFGVDPPPDATPPTSVDFSFHMAPRDGGIDAVYGYEPFRDDPGGLWHAQIADG